MKTEDIIHLFNNLIGDDIHTTIDYILKQDSSYTEQELLEWYDNL